MIIIPLIIINSTLNQIHYLIIQSLKQIMYFNLFEVHFEDSEFYFMDFSVIILKFLAILIYSLIYKYFQLHGHDQTILHQHDNLQNIHSNPIIFFNQ